MKRYYLMLALSCIFVLNCAMQCDDGDFYYKETYDSLVEIKVHNVNNEGKSPFLSDDPIKKEAYVIAVAYMVKDSLQHVFPIREYQGLVEEPQLKIITVNEFNDEYQAGSDITSLFTFYPGSIDIYSQQLILRYSPKIGIYSFIVEAHFQDTVLIAETNPIELK